jgi:hypothetical protein
LKLKIGTTPILGFLDLQQYFEIETDASDYSMGALLMEHRNPIYYHSNTFTIVVINYPTYNKELYVLVQSVKKVETLLNGKRSNNIY